MLWILHTTWSGCLAIFLFFVATQDVSAAKPKDAPIVGPPVRGATFETAFAVLGGRTVSDGRLRAPFYDYVISPHAIVDGNTVFCAFQNSNGRPQVMAYHTTKKTWSGPVTASEFGLGRDDHGNPSICIDREGSLHVFYGCHGGPMRHTKSRAPRDITGWQEQSPSTPRATYPQSMLMADGTICLFYRAGGHMEPWTLRTTSDNCRTWSKPQRIIEMRLDPPDRLAAAYCDFFPGSDHRTIHCFWNHKDDNAARVTKDRPHPWRPLKYKGLHEAVYRYNVYYVRRDADGQWRNAAGEAVKLPISKAEADARCLVYDSGDEFAMLGTRLAVDEQNRPSIRFGTGVVDWVRQHKDPNAVIVPVTRHWARFESGQWRISDQAPADWPDNVRRVVKAPGPLAYGKDWPAGHWYIFSVRREIKPNFGCAVFLHNDQSGFATRADGPALVD